MSASSQGGFFFMMVGTKLISDSFRERITEQAGQDCAELFGA
jgi:hypothetical protein